MMMMMMNRSWATHNDHENEEGDIQSDFKSIKSIIIQNCIRFWQHRCACRIRIVCIVFTPSRLWHPRRAGPDGGIEGHQVGMEMPPFRHVQQGQGALPRTALFTGTDATGKGNDLIFFLLLWLLNLTLGESIKCFFFFSLIFEVDEYLSTLDTVGINVKTCQNDIRYWLICKVDHHSP